MTYGMTQGLSVGTRLRKFDPVRGGWALGTIVNVKTRQSESDPKATTYTYEVQRDCKNLGNIVFELDLISSFRPVDYRDDIELVGLNQPPDMPFGHIELIDMLPLFIMGRFRVGYVLWNCWTEQSYTMFGKVCFYNHASDEVKLKYKLSTQTKDFRSGIRECFRSPYIGAVVAVVDPQEMLSIPKNTVGNLVSINYEKETAKVVTLARVEYEVPFAACVTQRYSDNAGSKPESIEAYNSLYEDVVARLIKNTDYQGVLPTTEGLLMCRDDAEPEAGLLPLNMGGLSNFSRIKA